MLPAAHWLPDGRSRVPPMQGSPGPVAAQARARAAIPWIASLLPACAQDRLGRVRPAMRSKVLRFEVVDEDEQQTRLHGMLSGCAA